MKTDILKLKAVVIALAIASTAQANQSSMQILVDTAQNLSSSTPILKVDAPQELSYKIGQNDDQFFEYMFIQIGDTVNAIVDLVKSFIDKNNKESFSAYINRCQVRLLHIEKNILAPLRAELTNSRSVRPGSVYHKILEATYNLANELAYKELQTLYTILDTHRKSPDAKKATTLAGVLRPHLTKLTSVASLDLLDQKLTEIYNLLILEKHPMVTQELEKLKTLVKEIKVKTTAIQNTVNIELLPIISARLKKP